MKPSPSMAVAASKPKNAAPARAPVKADKDAAAADYQSEVRPKIGGQEAVGHAMVTPAQPWEPAFSGQRPPFGPGNTAALTHGAYTPRRVEPLSTEIVERLLADDSVAYLRERPYRAAVWRYAQHQARADLVWATLVDHGVECTGCKQCLMWERRWAELDASAGRAGQRLGLDPLSRAKLGKDYAQGKAADAAAELTRMREEHVRATTATDPGAVQ